MFLKSIYYIFMFATLLVAALHTGMATTTTIKPSTTKQLTQATLPTTISTLVIAKNHTQTSQLIGQIFDIKTNVTLYDRQIPQLLVSWTDTLAKDESYNVIVNNITECSDVPCSVYGITKTENELLIPENPMTHVDVSECSFVLGCNYSVTVETSNTKITNTTQMAFPYCIMDVCSCQHAIALPKVLIVANTPRNDTINLIWSIRLHDTKMYNTMQHMLEAMKLSKLYLRISEQSNPSLSWGGKLITIIEKIYDIEKLAYAKTKYAIQGSIIIKMREQLRDHTSLVLHAYLIDELKCTGPANFMKVIVPKRIEAEAMEIVESDFNLRIALIYITIAVFLCMICASLMMCFWKRRKAKIHTNSTMKRDEQYLSPFATMVDMEDNINYVDKDVEEAQAKGLADVFEVPHHAVHIGEEIGEGAFGRVYKAVAVNLRRMRGSTLVAIKQLKKNPSSDEVAEFLSEIEMLKGVGTHNNIVCFMGCCTIRAPYLMIMEYVGRGDLLTYLRTVRNEATKFQSKDANHSAVQKQTNSTPKDPVNYIELKISTQSIDSDAEMETRQPKPSFAETTYTIIEDDEYKEPFEYILNHKELHNFAIQIANGMRFLEEQEITHRDLAARNVLIDDCKTLKISDFGLSRHGIYTNTKTRKLPLRWLSIEAIRDNIYSSKSDVWAYGVVLWEIGTLGASPYPTISNSELIPFLLEGKRLDKPEICTEQVYALMLRCWHADAEQRPTFDELYNELSPKTAYVDINSLSDDYVFPPIKDKDSNYNN